LKEGLEKFSESKDNMSCKFDLAFLDLIGCPPFWAVFKLVDLISLLEGDSLFFTTKKCKTLLIFLLEIL